MVLLLSLILLLKEMTKTLLTLTYRKQFADMSNL